MKKPVVIYMQIRCVRTILTIGSTCTLLVVTFQLALNWPLEAQAVSASILNKVRTLSASCVAIVQKEA